MVAADQLGEPHVRDVHVAGASIRVAELGSGPVLLLINGIGARLESWRPLVHRLARHRRVVMFDAPGTGESAALPRPVRMPELARLVGELLDVIGERRVDVLGYSWGGQLAQQFARDAADRVRRLILVSTTPGLGGRPPSLAAALAVSTPLYILSRPYAAAAALTVYGGNVSSHRARRELTRWLNEPRRPYGYACQLYATTGWTSLPWLHRIAHPTLVISGNDDPLVPQRNARLLAAGIPKARLKLLSDAGHLWVLECADESAAMIERFLR
jgi:pimeloyl-ACP methyl ester carboxylesterase